MDSLRHQHFSLLGLFHMVKETEASGARPWNSTALMLLITLLLLFWINYTIHFNWSGLARGLYVTKAHLDTIHLHMYQSWKVHLLFCIWSQCAKLHWVAEAASESCPRPTPRPRPHSFSATLTFKTFPRFALIFLKRRHCQSARSVGSFEILTFTSNSK